MAVSHVFNYSEEYWIMLNKYTEIADNLYCLWGEESSYGTRMKGDNGLAIGHFQIHIDKHPEVSYECAMNFECSLNFTVKSIQAGHGWWWTPFQKCFNNN